MGRIVALVSFLVACGTTTYVRPPIPAAELARIRTASLSQRVDVTMASGDRFEIDALQLEDDAVSQDGKSVPYAAVSRLSWRDQGMGFRNGLLIGTPIGLGIGLLGVLPCAGSGLKCGSAAVASAALGALGGLLIGAVAGAIAGGECTLVVGDPPKTEPSAAGPAPEP